MVGTIALEYGPGHVACLVSEILLANVLEAEAQKMLQISDSPILLLLGLYWRPPSHE